MSIQPKRRRLLLENLEGRNLMAADCFNLFAPLDVNDDSIVTATDALKIIDQLNDGNHRLNDSPATKGFVDVNDDGIVTATDALKVINWLNEKAGIARQPATDWTKIAGEGKSRLGVKTVNQDDGSVVLELRVQNAAAASAHDIFLKDTWLGSIKTDNRGRGSFKLGTDNDVLDRLPELLLTGQANGALTVESVGTLDVPGKAEGSPERSAENNKLRSGGIFTAQLNTTSGERTGQIVYGKHHDKQFLGVYARGLTADQSYEVKIDGVVVASPTANAAGVIATRIDVTKLTNFPTIASGLDVSVGEYSGKFESLGERVRIPQDVFVANLTGNRRIGAAQIATGENRTVIGIQLGKVAANTTFAVLIDDVKVAEVKSNERGLIFYRLDTQRGDQLLADLPTLSAGSVLKIGEIVTAKLRKLGGKN